MRRMLLCLSVLGAVATTLAVVLIVGLDDGTARSADGLTAQSGHAAQIDRTGSSDLSATMRVNLARAQRQAQARRRWLARPAAKAQRARSQLAFHDLETARARELLMRDYGPILSGASANPAATIARSDRLVRYLSNNRALVRGKHGLEIAHSTVPLRVGASHGVERPVDLHLTRTAEGFAPVRPLAAVSIAQDSAGGVAVGASGLRLMLVGAKVNGVPVGEQGVFFAGVGPDTDAAITPTIDGAELFAELRSRLSPRELHYVVTLPSGAVLRASSGGGAVISRGGKALADIPAPSARDAQNSAIGVSMSVQGDELVMNVDPQGTEVAYPLLVDPSVIIPTEKSEGWKFTKMRRLCEEETQVFDKPPGEGAPAVVEAPSRSYPRPELPPCTESPKINYERGWGELSWTTSAHISTAEFDDISLAFGIEPEKSYKAVYWRLASCNRDREGYNPNSPPSSIALSATHCNKAFGSGVTLELMVGELGESKPVTVSATLSVGAIMLYEPWVLAEESETYGEENESEPHRKYCLTGRPVNCATGNQTETQTDLRVGGRGPGLALTRTYNSRLAAKQKKEHGPFGFGWTYPYDANLTTALYCPGEACDGEVATVTQGNGSTVKFLSFEGGEWKPVGPLVQAKLVTYGKEAVYTLPDQSKITFKGGLLTSESDRNGNAITLTHNPEHENRVESIADSASRKITFAYNSEGLVESAKDPLGNTVKYAYEEGNLISVTEPGETHPSWQFKYNAAHEMIGETDGLGHTITTEYDSSDRVISQTDPMKRTRSWEYLGEIEGTEEATETLIEEPNGTKTYEKFNNQDLPTYVEQVAESHYAVTEYIYDLYGNLIAAANPNRQTTRYTYNAEGDRTSETNPDGDETQWQYDGTHDVVAITNPLKITTTIKRDARGNAESISRPGPGNTTQTTHYKYDSHGDLESVTDPLERTWTYEYDSYGDRIGEADPLGDKRSWGYNEDSQETSEVTPRGNVKGEEAAKFTTKTERDPQGRPTIITDPLGRVTKYAYDAAGNIENVTDPNGHESRYFYDADNEPIKIEDPNGTTIETGYDSAGQTISQTDGNGHPTQYVRNGFEEVAEVIDPLGRRSKKEYDLAGNLERVTSPREQVTAYHYDPANRLTEVDYSEETTAPVKYQRNTLGEVTNMTDGTGTSTYEYDVLNRLVQATNGHAEKIGYGYDLANEQTKLTYPNGQSVTHGYDNDGRLQTVTDWLGHQTKFAYNPNSDLTATAFPSGTNNQDKYTYNDADQMSEIQMTKGTETLASLVYTRDNDGQVGTVINKGLPGEEKSGYSYDSNDRLIKAGTAVYGYDAANNPIKLGSTLYTYDNADQLKTGSGVRYGFSEEGERVKSSPSGAATTYGYNIVGDLVSAERPVEGKTPAISDTYTYDGNGLRASQTISGTTTHMTWDTIESPPRLLSDGTNSYIYGPEGLPIEQINTSTGTTTYLHHDQAGSTRLLTGSTGTVTGKCTYGAYGTPTCEGASTTPLGYDGQYTSADTGLIYMRARVYDPATAQFLSVDPLAAISGAPYDYAGDNPLNRSDPTGLLFGISLPSWEEVGEGIAGWGDTITFGGTNWVREEIGDNNINACSGAYQGGGIAGLVTGALIPGEDDAEAGELGVEGVDEGADVGSTPEGRPFTQHYGLETGPERNIPGSVVDQTVNENPGVPGRSGTTVYYDPKNDVTVVTGRNGAIVSARRGAP